MLTDGATIDNGSWPRVWTLRHGPPVLAYAALTLLFAWPLVIAPGTRVPHDLGDPLLSTWTVWWNATRVPFTEPWWNGNVFYPSPGALAFSDHRVGIGLITTPLIFAGVSPLAAHNVAWTLSYFLSAVTAYLLGWSLTRRRTGGFIAGLVFAFHPFRAEHLPHLELLSSYWLPLVLLALHRWLASRQRRWLVLLGVSFTLVGVTTGYYFLFLCVLLALWCGWFLPWNLPFREYGKVGLALGIPLVVLAPVFLQYRTVHRQYGLGRSITEIEELSADLRGWITPPEPLWLWDAPAAWHTPEGALFPGLTAVLLVAAAAAVRWRAARRNAQAEADAHARNLAAILRRVILAAGLVALLAGLWAAVAGPLAVSRGFLRISVTQPYKPLSVAMILIVLWALTSPSIKARWRAHSPFAFYVLATIAMAVFTLGPTARAAGERVLYKAPYSWLMVLPGFSDGLRAPGRFAMMSALCLAPAAALGFVRLTRGLHPRWRGLAAAAISAGVLADGWIFPLPVAPAPAPLAITADVPPDAAVLELPSGVFEDATAMYHGSQHGRPVVNGLSGYEPPHYAALQSAIRDGDTSVLDALAIDRPLAVFLARMPATAILATLLPSQSRARPLGQTATHDIFVVPAARRPSAPRPRADHAVAIRSLDATVNTALLGRATDGDRRTAWIAEGPQRGNEQLTVSLASASTVSAVVVSLGSFTWGFPRYLTISVSEDGQNWRAVWKGTTGAPAVAAALDDPLDVRVLLEFPPSQAAYVRLAQTGQSVENAWAIAEIGVLRP